MKFEDFEEFDIYFKRSTQFFKSNALIISLHANVKDFEFLRQGN